MAVRITGIDETTLVMPSPNRNANLSFAAMTASAVVIHTDAMRNGRPLVGLGFDSIGRYGHGGLARERFIPRLLAALPDDYCDANGRLDPTRAFTVMMRDEKPGGHGDRAGAVGLIDSALWDSGGQARGQAAMACALGALWRRRCGPPRRGLCKRRALPR